MSEMIISTSSLMSHKQQQVRIDGKVYTLRELGAGDRLDISQITRRLAKMHGQMMELKQQAEATQGETDEKTIMKLMDEIGAKVELIAELRTKLLGCYARAIDDGTEKQLETKKLLEIIDIEGAQRLFDQVFKTDDQAEEAK